MTFVELAFASLYEIELTNFVSYQAESNEKSFHWLCQSAFNVVGVI